MKGSWKCTTLYSIEMGLVQSVSCLEDVFLLMDAFHCDVCESACTTGIPDITPSLTDCHTQQLPDSVSDTSKWLTPIVCPLKENSTLYIACQWRARCIFQWTDHSKYCTFQCSFRILICAIFVVFMMNRELCPASNLAQSVVDLGGGLYLYTYPSYVGKQHIIG